jgi:hypothetical protein
MLAAIACGHGDDTAANPFAGDDGGLGSDASCSAGETQPCQCLNGQPGSQSCGAAGTFGACACASAEAAPAQCGDNRCEMGETCETCPNDCGQCPKCDLAPSCSDGLALPSQTPTVKFEDLSTPAPAPVDDAGAPVANNCADAQLRLRISRIEVEHQAQEVYLPTGTLSGPAQSYYCLLQASDGAVVPSADAGMSNGTFEVALTKPTALIPDYGGADFGPVDSMFWGQQGPRLTQGNLTITYSCFQQKQPGSNSWTAVLNAAGMAAGSLAGAGPYGWAFGLGSIALQAVAAAVAAAQQQGDWHMFDVTHTIDKSRLLDLTNGREWSFTQSGGNHAFQYPWSITVHVESWGCADPLPSASR